MNISRFKQKMLNFSWQDNRRSCPKKFQDFSPSDKDLLRRPDCFQIYKKQIQWFLESLKNLVFDPNEILLEFRKLWKESLTEYFEDRLYRYILYILLFFQNLDCRNMYLKPKLVGLLQEVNSVLGLTNLLAKVEFLELSLASGYKRLILDKIWNL